MTMFIHEYMRTGSLKKIEVSAWKGIKLKKSNFYYFFCIEKLFSKTDIILHSFHDLVFYRDITLRYDAFTNLKISVGIELFFMHASAFSSICVCMYAKRHIWAFGISRGKRKNVQPHEMKRDFFKAVSKILRRWKKSNWICNVLYYLHLYNT